MSAERDIERDIERINRAFDRVDTYPPEMVPWLQVSATLEVALQIAKLRESLEQAGGSPAPQGKA